MKYNKRRFKKDLIFLLSIGLAIWLAKSPYLQQLIDSSMIFLPLTIFFAGLFFTSFLTIPISLVTLFLLGQDHNPLFIALIGGLGAALGDLILIKLLRQLASREFPLLFLSSKLLAVLVGVYSPFISHLLPKSVTHLPLNFISFEKRVFIKALRSHFVRAWVLPIVGAAIIASPFPDEAGIVLLGASTIDYRKAFLLSFILNSIGIFIIASSAKIL